MAVSDKGCDAQGVTPTELHLADRIKSLEKELKSAVAEAFFSESDLAAHKGLKQGLFSYLLHARILAYLTAPIIYSGIVPFFLLDAFLTVYQGICFPVYGVPKVKRGDYIFFDRGRLKYLNLLERLNCAFCSYGNGLFAYAVEIAARTEQHWCPIKHARRLNSPHSRYSHFFNYGDAAQYRQEVDAVRNDFVDLRSIAPAKGKS
jgi:hypothetical protein